MCFLSCDGGLMVVPVAIHYTNVLGTTSNGEMSMYRLPILSHILRYALELFCSVVNQSPVSRC